MKTNPLRTFEQDARAWHEVLRTKNLEPSVFEITQQMHDIIADWLKPPFAEFMLSVCNKPCVIIDRATLH